MLLIKMLKILNNKVLLFLALLLFMSSCEESYIPKPRGYYRLALPKKEYKEVQAPQFSLEILKSCNFKIKESDSTWTTIDYPPLNASLYLTFFHNNDIAKLTEDARKSAYKHAIKADEIINMPFAIPEKHLYGMIYSIEGNAASPVIFQFTDSLSQFLHGAVYFNSEPNADSLKPVVAFVRQDIEHIIETFKWNATTEKQEKP